jgi:hypothetical protein
MMQVHHSKGSFSALVTTKRLLHDACELDTLLSTGASLCRDLSWIISNRWGHFMVYVSSHLCPRQLHTAA